MGPIFKDVYSLVTVYISLALGEFKEDEFQDGEPANINNKQSPMSTSILSG